MGALGFDEVHALALVPSSGKLYGVSDGDPGLLITIDPVDFVGTTVGVTPPDSHVRDLAFHAATGVIYGVDPIAGTLVIVNGATGADSAVGPIGFGSVAGLACVPGSSKLFATDAATGALLAIDPDSGQGTSIGSLGFDDVQGLDFDAFSGLLYGTDATTRQLIVIDRETGQGTVVGSTTCPVFDLSRPSP